MTHKVRMLVGALLLALTLLGAGWATNVPPVHIADGPPGANGG